MYFLKLPSGKVIIEKSCGVGSLMEQDTIENVSKHNVSKHNVSKHTFYLLFKKNNIFLTSFYSKNVFTVCNV